MTTLCVGASSGGHMTELNALLRHADGWPLQPTVQISTLSQLADASEDEGHFVLGECNRTTPLAALGVIWRSIRIVARTRPDVVVTTGSLPLCLFALVARVSGARVIWIDSISQVDELSLSGRLIKPFASRFYVQWPGLEEKYEGVTYAGELV